MTIFSPCRNWRSVCSQAGRAPHAGNALALLGEALGQGPHVAHQRLEGALGVAGQRLTQPFGPVDPGEARRDDRDQRGAAGEDEKGQEQEIAGRRLALAEVAQVVHAARRTRPAWSPLETLVTVTWTRPDGSSGVIDHDAEPGRFGAHPPSSERQENSVG